MAQRDSAAALSRSRGPAGRRAVVFLSSIPTDMRPSEVRSHFQEFGEIFRQKFTAFPRKTHRNVRGAKSTDSLQFKEGYLEFLRAEDAAAACETLNGQPVCTKRRRRSFGQLWNCRVLEGFVWGMIAEGREEVMRSRKAREFAERQAERDANEAFRLSVQSRQLRGGGGSLASRGGERELTAPNMEGRGSEQMRKKHRAERGEAV